jgi:hypothetical protein
MIKVDAIKYAYRQNKDGFVVSFVIHPNDAHKELANADIGSQWELTLVGLDEDGNAPQKAQTPEPGEPPARVRLTLAQRAGMLCKDHLFRQFLRDAGTPVHDDVEAATALRLICGVKTRADILPGTNAGDAFEELHADYTVWLRHSDAVA